MGIRHAPNHGQSAGRQARSRAGITWPVDPTDPKVGVLDIDGVRYDLLSPPNAKMLAVSVTASSFVINDHAKPKDYSHFLSSDRI